MIGAWLRYAAITLFAVMALSPLGASARIKIDRYEPTALPGARLWVTMLRDQDWRSIPPEESLKFRIMRDGFQVTDDVEFMLAKEADAPRAIAVVADGRYPERWKSISKALGRVFTDQPGDSRAAVCVYGKAIERLPKERWSDAVDQLPSNLAGLLDADYGGEAASRQFACIEKMLERFPLAPGVEQSPEDGVVPEIIKERDGEFPLDRVLYVVTDGVIDEGLPRSRVDEVLRAMVFMARRRGVRIMTITLPDEGEGEPWALRVLARKSGGTHRAATDDEGSLKEAIEHAAEELDMRYVLEAEILVEQAPPPLPGDVVSFVAEARMSGGRRELSLEYSAIVENRLGWFARSLDWLNDLWETMPWWGRAIIWFVLGLIVFIIALVKIIRRRRAAAAAANDQAQAAQAFEASKKPCSVCGRTMMPDWKECLFCAQDRAKEVPMRFRLVGRSGLWEGQVLRFAADVVDIGAEAGCPVRINERGVAPRHCGIRDRGDAQFVLTDYNTDSGTFVNGERITQTALQEGDVIRVGDNELVFGIEAQAAAAVKAQQPLWD
ncbi:MAG: FHA domain-containing protein [Bradymonadia bacterium]